MALEHQIQIAAEHFGVSVPEDWCNVRAEWIRQVHGCGPQTVDHLRIYLAARGLTLQDDATPEYWQKNLSAAKIGGQISMADTAVTLPFTILVDKAEQQPFTFKGFLSDSETAKRPLLVPTEFVSLGPTHGDYTIKGMEGDCHIERKGLGDAQGTFLSHGERRERWDATLEFLAGVQTAAVVVECSFLTLMMTIKARGSRSQTTLKKTLHRQVLAWQQDTRVPFIFCDNRRLAESTVLQICRRHWRHAMGKAKKTKQDKTQEARNLDAASAAL